MPLVVSSCSSSSGSIVVVVLIIVYSNCTSNVVIGNVGFVDHNREELAHWRRNSVSA